jgi:hypothetical protein|tara:strand:+ start:359 stop:826 length:468 start_codon:yes stop_codon:yes gene_type:complete
MNTPWKTVQKFDYNSVSECISKLKEDGYKVSEWITDVGNRLEVKSHNYPVDLFRVKVSDLGFDSACKLKDIYQELFAKGFNTVSPDIAILTRFLYDEQPNGEWLRIATPFDSMTDSDGIPHLPKLGRGLGMYFIETYWSYRDAIFHPHNEFLVSS